MRAFKSNADIFIFTKELADLARENGDLKIAQALLNAIQENFLTSEIMGELCSVLEEILDTKDMEYFDPVQEDIKCAINAIRKAFMKANRPW